MRPWSEQISRSDGVRDQTISRSRGTQHHASFASTSEIRRLGACPEALTWLNRPSPCTDPSNPLIRIVCALTSTVCSRPYQSNIVQVF